MQTTVDHDRMLPQLDPGLTVLDVPARRSRSLHAVVVGALADGAREALWIDARNNASTYALDGLGPCQRATSSLQIARAFTAYQHHGLVRAAVREAGERTDLVVAPCVAALYRDDDLPAYRRPQLLESAVGTLAELAASLDVAVVVTEPGPADELSAIVADAADHGIDCVETDHGFRFEADGFETTVYRSEGVWQTTIPYWVELFGAVEAYERAGGAAETLRPFVSA